MAIVGVVAGWMERLSGAASGAWAEAPGDGWWLLAVSIFAGALLLGARRAATAIRTLRARALTPALSRQLAWWGRPRRSSGVEFFLADGADGPAVARPRC